MLHKFPIAKNGLWTGTYPGKTVGDIFQTKNINMESSQGRLLLADAAHVICNSIASGLGFATVNRFIACDASTTQRLWAVSTNKMLFNNQPTNPQAGSWATDSITDSPTTPIDAVINGQWTNGIYYSRLFVTTATDIWVLAGTNWTKNWWTSTKNQAALSHVAFHPIEVFNQIVAIGDGNLLHTIDKSDNITNSFFTFSPLYIIKNIYASSNRFWIGLQHKFGGKGLICEWDGYSNQPNNLYEIDGSPLSGFIYKNSPFFINEYGDILSLQGSYFEKYGISFPVYEEQKSFLGSPTVPPIGNHGCVVLGTEVFINLSTNTSSTTGFSQRVPSGIWRVDMNKGTINHAYGLGSTGVDGNIQDYGEDCLAAAGAGAIALIPNSPSVLIASAQLSSDSTYNIYCLSADTINTNRGYVITTVIPSNEIDDTWETLWLKFRKFYKNTNSIVAKYRTTDGYCDIYSNPLVALIHWIGATSFSGILPIGVKVGDEVEILTGNNASCSFHILTLSATPDGGSTITVTIDETAPKVSSGYSYAKFDNWVKIGSVTSSTIFSQKLSIASAGSLATSPFIQFKIELRGVRQELHEIKIISKTQNEAEL